MPVCKVRDGDGRSLLDVLDALKQGSQGSSGVTVHVLPSTDHDGVCSAKIFDSLLKRMGVKNTFVPVTGTTEIIEHIQQFDQECEVRSLVLLNCGASLHLQQQLEECRAPAELRCFLVDAHRPFLLPNLSRSSSRVIVVDDDPIAEATRVIPPVDEDVEDDEEEEDGDDIDSDGEKENTWPPPAPEELDRQKAEAAARRERKLLREERRHQLEEHRHLRVQEYYRNSYCATPVAMSLFKMARQADTISDELLWLAAVSLAGYRDLGLVTEVEYSRLVWDELKEALDHEDVGGFSQSYGGGSGSTHLEAGLPSDDEGPARSRTPRGVRPSQRHHQTLRFENDLRLTLYKHWDLEQAIMHSSYFYGALELHRDKGLRTMKDFLASSGIPPRDFQQLYRCMQTPIRKTLHQKFRDRGKAFGLKEEKMFLQQFVRTLGTMENARAALFLSEFSATDAVHIVTALLGVVPPSLSNARTDTLPQSADGRRDAARVHELERQAMVENFWLAFDAVLCKDAGLLRDGLAAAVEVVKAVQSLARLIIDTKGLRLTPSRHFCWCKVEQPPNQFRHLLTVRRLAVWLQHVVYAYRPKSPTEETPLLVVMRDHVRDTYLCVGASPTQLAERNEFGQLFRKVIQADTTIKYKYDFFDKSIIEIAADDFDRFWDTLVEYRG